MRDKHVYLKKQASEEMNRHLNDWFMQRTPEFRTAFIRCIPILKCNYVKQIYLFKDNRDRDYDNYSGKVMFDVFKEKSILKNDCSKIIGESTQKFIFGCKIKYGYVIEIDVGGQQDMDCSHQDCNIFSSYNKEVDSWIDQTKKEVI